MENFEVGDYLYYEGDFNSKALQVTSITKDRYFVDEHKLPGQFILKQDIHKWRRETSDDAILRSIRSEIGL